jgi:hypothetical protein
LQRVAFLQLTRYLAHYGQSDTGKTTRERQNV